MAKQHEMELHFFPGQHLLLVREKDEVKASVEAWGGPKEIGNDPSMPEEPTWPGEYRIGRSEAYRTPSWGWSVLKWGTPLQDKGEKLDDVWYRTSGGRWASIAKDYKISRRDIMRFNADLYSSFEVPKTWVFNDFGPLAIRWFKDLNNNGIMDGKEALSGQMFHTTQVNEAQAANGMKVRLVPSHGCIHLKPADRDRLIGMGVFRPGTKFIVHSYGEMYER